MTFGIHATLLKRKKVVDLYLIPLHARTSLTFVTFRRPPTIRRDCTHNLNGARNLLPAAPEAEYQIPAIAIITSRRPSASRGLLA